VSKKSLATAEADRLKSRCPGANQNIAIDNSTTDNDIPLDGFDFEDEIRRIRAKQKARAAGRELQENKPEGM
jgi:hypothetical protein